MSRLGRDGIGRGDSKVKKYENDADRWQERVKADTRASELKASQARSSESADIARQMSQSAQGTCKSFEMSGKAQKEKRSDHMVSRA